MTELERLSRVAKLRSLRSVIDQELGALDAGGLEVTARERLAAHPVNATRPVATCGTDGGYYRHLRTTKTVPCHDCLSAHRDYERARYRRQKESAA